MEKETVKVMNGTNNEVNKQCIESKQDHPISLDINMYVGGSVEENVVQHPINMDAPRYSIECPVWDSQYKFDDAFRLESQGMNPWHNRVAPTMDERILSYHQSWLNVAIWVSF